MQPNAASYVDYDYVAPGYYYDVSVPYDDPLDDVIHDNIMSITNLSYDMVRPRFSPEPATHPPLNVNWVAFGVSTFNADNFPSIIHDPSGNASAGMDTVERDELVQINVSFYGPQNGALLSQYRDGLFIEANRYDLAAAGLALVEVGQVINLPALLKDKWVKRLDTKITFRRRVAHQYNVPHLLASRTSLNAEVVVRQINLP